MFDEEVLKLMRNFKICLFNYNIVLPLQYVSLVHFGYILENNVSDFLKLNFDCSPFYFNMVISQKSKEKISIIAKTQN